MAQIAIASTNQYVFKRNFPERKWEPVGMSGKTCRVQVSMKNDEFYFKIQPEEGAVSCWVFELIRMLVLAHVCKCSSVPVCVCV